jgi:ABC-type multidrug transport system ATPase subunit
MLQPEKRRRVLILDDPTSGFDNANHAGFASTLRAFVRLLKPEQVVVTTHDDSVAAVLTEELAVVDDWPRSVARLRFQRDENDFSAFSVEDCSKETRKFEPETRRLGLPEDAPAV